MIKRDRQHIQSLMRAFDILEVVRDSTEPMRATDIATATNLGVATAHNIIRTLYAREYLAQDKNNHYMLGVACMQLRLGSSNYFSRMREVVDPVVKELAIATNDTTFFGCESNASLVCVALSTGKGYLVVQPEQIWLEKLHCTGAGKVIIAEKGIDWFAKLAEQFPLQKVASKTITTIEKMGREIEKIKKDGYSLCVRECTEDVSALGIPVYAENGEFLGALAQSIPTVFFEAGRVNIEERVNILRKYAEKITEQF
jgi:IclR family transcriptional regulator, KDG regulon repressor